MLFLLAMPCTAINRYFTEGTTCNYTLLNIDEPTATLADCSFLITSAIELQGGGYRVCVQANDQVFSQSWQIIMYDLNGVPSVTMTGSNPAECWDFPIGNPTFGITHTVEGMNCLRFIFILSEENFCPANAVTASVENCQFEATLDIGLENIGNPWFSYVITFGDGSPAEEHTTGQINHTFPGAGNYEVCLSYFVPNSEIGHVTCCYDVNIPGCSCPQHVVQITTVEPCTWLTTMNFDLPAAYFPITVDYGDGTSEVVNSSPVMHDYPDNDCYKVCYTYEPIPGNPITCCELVCLPQCCLDASFTVVPDYANGWGSCYNPEYVITPTACLNSVLEVTHIWEFPDGEVFYGPFPPNQIFTNFAHATQQICISHTIICCDESVTAEVCIDHFPAAYIGTSGGVTNLSDLIPTTGQTVLQFIQQNANGPNPLLIDGQLNINVANALFTGGTWNMGRNSEIVVMGTDSIPRRDFRLSGTTVQSAVRLNLPLFLSCCRWRGIRSEKLTAINLNNATIRDAEYAVHYPFLTVGTPFPTIRSTNSTFENNFYVIKSNRQHVLFSRFHRNTLNGTTLAPHVCGCTAVNAIDFRDVGGVTTISIDDYGFGQNEIFNYEKGLNFRNTSLIARGFNIHDLREYDDSPGMPNNPAGQAAIGIDFFWNNAANSRLEIDRISFTDFVESDALSYAVRDRVTRGWHTLRALASTPGSINTAGIAGGYDLNITSPARLLAGSIIGRNTIQTEGSNNAGEGFGITGNFTAADNVLEIRDNTITVSTNGGAPMNGGIVLTSTEDLPQPFSIENNFIYLGLTNGVGIAVNGARGYCVGRNWIGNASDATGILLSGGGDATVECNEVLHKPTGIRAVWSDVNTYSGNYLSLNVNDMHFTGDCRGASRSTIQWNTFDFSSQPSLVYDLNAFTGAQTHNNYNSWTGQANQGGGNVEVQHDSPANSFFTQQSRFHHPSNAQQGSVHFPNRDPQDMMLPAANNNITSIPSTFCTSTNGCFAMLQGPDSEDDYEALVQDAGAWSGLTSAEQAFLRQGIYGLLLENPSWVSGSSTLSGFKASHDGSFVGQSETLRHDWQQLMNDISAHQATLQPIYDSLDVLANQLQQWFDAIAADSSLEVSLQGQMDAAIQQGEALAEQLHQSEDQFAPTVQAAIAQLKAQNTALSGAAQHEWNEKRYNEIALKWLAGTEPDATAADDLRTIAQTCLPDGGRAVLDARGLCAVWLKEYYDEGNCNIGERSTDGANAMDSGTIPTLRIVPNPADDMVWISLQSDTNEEQQVQIFSMEGRQVFSGKLPHNGTLVISVKGWQGGLYIAKITGDSTTFTRSFVVQHP